MSVKLYRGIANSTVPATTPYCLRATVTLACKRGNKLAKSRVRFTVGSDVSLQHAFQTVYNIAEKIGEHSHGQIVSLTTMLGHFIKDKAFSEEPKNAKYAILTFKSSTGPGRSRVFIPWCRSGNMDALETEVTTTGNVFEDLAAVHLDTDATSIKVEGTPEFKGLIYKMMKAVSDVVIVSGDVQGDQAGDGMVSDDDA